ncbi:MAG: phosphoribosylformylglycinamidine synthase I [Omnitrophica WOR_2 bacterium RIFCSPLOWO2_12_FULL_46_30]|nr:MAG: phosphoribosylformylglycinamidine synthase I [Omnitrophica WOR_2 bacterium RIFCSPLOWO2_12_FULL_46_30]
MARPRVLVLRSAGTNCDNETAFAFSKAGAQTELVHINQLKGGLKKLSDYQILALPGGFSYGDALAAGKILANELRYKLIKELKKFIHSGKLLIGICNGFQILVKAGLLPGNPNLEQEATLTINDSAKFEDRWVYLKKPETRNHKPERCIWTRNLPEIIYLPVAHGEGKFVAKDNAVLERLEKNRQIVLRYCNEEGEYAGYPYNPNGSRYGIAGICDETGRIFGLMPHPERHSFGWQHPRWMRQGLRKEGDGLQIFKNGVSYARKFL